VKLGEEKRRKKEKEEEKEKEKERMTGAVSSGRNGEAEEEMARRLTKRAG
jgi:hypothetical protein